MDEESGPLGSGTMGDRKREACRSGKEMNYVISMLCFTNRVCTIVTKPYCLFPDLHLHFFLYFAHLICSEFFNRGYPRLPHEVHTSFPENMH